MELSKISRLWDVKCQDMLSTKWWHESSDPGILLPKPAQSYARLTTKIKRLLRIRLTQKVHDR